MGRGRRETRQTGQEPVTLADIKADDSLCRVRPGAPVTPVGRARQRRTLGHAVRDGRREGLGDAERLRSCFSCSPQAPGARSAALGFRALAARQCSRTGRRPLRSRRRLPAHHRSRAPFTYDAGGARDERLSRCVIGRPAWAGQGSDRRPRRASGVSQANGVRARRLRLNKPS